MSNRRSYYLRDERERAFVQSAVARAPLGYIVTVSEGNRSLGQNAIFHAICDDIAKSGHVWFGKARTAEEWKILLISAHASETGRGCDMVQGLNGEFVQLRESSAAMSKPRATSLIEYATAWATSHGIQLRDAP